MWQNDIIFAPAATDALMKTNCQGSHCIFPIIEVLDKLNSSICRARLHNGSE